MPQHEPLVVGQHTGFGEAGHRLEQERQPTISVAGVLVGHRHRLGHIGLANQHGQQRVLQFPIRDRHDHRPSSWIDNGSWDGRGSASQTVAARGLAHQDRVTAGR